MAIDNFTINIDTLTGTEGNDWFNARPNNTFNTLQTGDSVDGKEGWDTIYAILYGQSNRIMPTATNVEKLKLELRGSISNHVTLDLGEMSDVEKVRIENSIGEHTLDNTDHVKDFVFFNDSGTLSVLSNREPYLDFSFTDTGTIYTSYVLNFENLNATEMAINVDNSLTSLSLIGNSALTHADIVNTNSVGFLEISQNVKSLEDIHVGGTGKFKLKMDGTVRKMESYGADGFTGKEFVFELDGNTAANAHLQTGRSNDGIHIEGNVANGTSIYTGQGGDVVLIEGNTGDNVLVRTGNKPGKDMIVINGNVGNGFQIYTEEGKDSLYIKNDLGRDAYIHMGKGIDTLRVDGGVADGASMMMGAGDDIVVLAGPVGANVSITTGMDNDTVIIGSGLDAHQTIATKEDNDNIQIMGDLKGGATIDAGAGNDMIALMDNTSSPSIFYAVENATILAGDGNDTVWLKDIGSSVDTNVDGGAGIDTILLDAATIHDYSVGSRKHIKPGASHFEVIYINEQDTVPDQVFDVSKFGTIEKVQFLGAVEGENNVLSGIGDGVTVSLFGNNSGKLKLDMEESENMVNLEVGNTGSALYQLGLMGKVQTLNISTQNAYSYGIDLDGTAQLEKIVITGDANVELRTGGTLLEASSLEAGGREGAVAVNLSKDRPDGMYDKSVITGKGDDRVTTREGNDTVQTGAGNDTVFTGEGRDTVIAGKGDDVIRTGQGQDRIEGKDGNDTIYAAKGKDTVIGGAGADQIHLGSNDGKEDVVVYTERGDSVNGARDVVYDFCSGEDKIDLKGVVGTVTYMGEYASQTELENAIAGAGAGSAGLLTGSSVLYVSIDGDTDLSDDMQIELVGIADLAPSDFV